MSEGRERLEAAITAYRRIVDEDTQLIAENPDIPEGFKRDAEQHKAALAQCEDAYARGGELRDYQGEPMSPKLRARMDAMIAKAWGKNEADSV